MKFDISAENPFYFVHHSISNRYSKMIAVDRTEDVHIKITLIIINSCTSFNHKSGKCYKNLFKERFL